MDEGSVSITDTASNVAANLDALQTLAAAGKLASVTLTDAGAPMLTLTIGQLTDDAAALSKIVGNYMISVSGDAKAASASSASSTTGVADTESMIVAEIAKIMIWLDAEVPLLHKRFDEIQARLRRPLGV